MPGGAISRRDVLCGLGGMCGLTRVGVSESAGTASAVETDQDSESWPQVGYAPSGTSYVPGITGAHRYTTIGEKGSWTNTVGYGIDGSPVVADGTVYVHDRDGNLHALDADTGRSRWERALGSTDAVSSPAVAGSVVYVGNGPVVHAVDAETGDIEWEFETADVIGSTPTVARDVIYVGSDDSALYAISAVDGTERWRFSTGGAVRSSPAVAEGVVYTGSRDGSLYAVDAASGDERWSFETDGSVGSSPAVSGGTVFIKSVAGTLYAVATDGSKLWQWEGSSDDWTDTASPAVDETRVYIGDRWGLYAVDRETGETRWRFTGPDSFNRRFTGVDSKPAVVDKTVYFTARGIPSHVYAVDKSSGTERWHVSVSETIGPASPAVVGDDIYVCTQDIDDATLAFTENHRILPSIGSLVAAATTAIGWKYWHSRTTGPTVKSSLEEYK